jgi:hypothetical protein
VGLVGRDQPCRVLAVRSNGPVVAAVVGEGRKPLSRFADLLSAATAPNGGGMLRESDGGADGFQGRATWLDR